MVVISDCRDEVVDTLLGGSAQQRIDHAACKLSVPSFLTDGNLPDKKRAGLRGGAIARHPSDHFSFHLCDNAVFGKMRALEEVAIGRISIKRWAARDESCDRGAI